LTLNKESKELIETSVRLCANYFSANQFQDFPELFFGRLYNSLCIVPFYSTIQLLSCAGDRETFFIQQLLDQQDII